MVGEATIPVPVRNKANSTRLRIGDCGLRIEGRVPVGRASPPASGPCWSIVQDKANSGRGRAGRSPADDKRLCKTKPIWRRRPETGAVGGSPRGELCETNPIPCRWGRGASPLWKRSYGELDMQQASERRTQLPEAAHRGGVSIADCGLRIGDRSVAGRVCETKPISPEWARKTIAKAGSLDAATHHGAIVGNKANLRRVRLELTGGVGYHSCPGNRPYKGQPKRR